VHPPSPDPAVRRILDWYAGHARDLPWRRPDAGAWGVLVSEVMLQQTPVSRVLAPWHAWMSRWPTPPMLAADTPADAIRMWGRLGYPRRALRLHRAAEVITVDHGGIVPADPGELRTLPGIGEYTAAAVASFAYRRRVPVLDTNVRRLLARLALGRAFPAGHLGREERALAESWCPADPARAARWAAASMELGALVCTARAPRCPDCPVADLCRWRAAGHPDGGQRPRSQSWEGTDRQCRGAILALLRAADAPVPTEDLRDIWPPRRASDTGQFDRALGSLEADGLAVSDGAGWSLPDRLPGRAPQPCHNGGVAPARRATPRGSEKP